MTDEGDDSLKRSTARLGNRFAGAEGEQDVESQADADGEEETEPEWVPTTIYLPEEIRREFRRFLKRLTLDHPEIEDAQKRELHAALVKVGMEHPEDVAERTEDGP